MNQVRERLQGREDVIGCRPVLLGACTRLQQGSTNTGAFRTGHVRGDRVVHVDRLLRSHPVVAESLTKV